MTPAGLVSRGFLLRLNRTRCAPAATIVGRHHACVAEMKEAIRRGDISEAVSIFLAASAATRLMMPRRRSRAAPSRLSVSCPPGSAPRLSGSSRKPALSGSLAMMRLLPRECYCLYCAPDGRAIYRASRCAVRRELSSDSRHCRRIFSPVVTPIRRFDQASALRHYTGDLRAWREI